MMKEMIYRDRMGQAEILANGNYNGYEYCVLSLGTHPCAYIILEENDRLYGLHYDIINNFDIPCHCGFTYSENYLKFLEFSEKYKSMVKSSITNKWVIGWDYAHDGDYVGWDIDNLLGGKKWNTNEIVNECKKIIDILAIINENKN